MKSELMENYNNSISYIRNPNFRVLLNYNKKFIAAKSIDISFYFRNKHVFDFKYSWG